jgi:hypothetical protein
MVLAAWMQNIVVFRGISDACSRNMVNGRLWFSKKLMSTLVPTRLVCWFAKVLRLDVEP